MKLLPSTALALILASPAFAQTVPLSSLIGTTAGTAAAGNDPAIQRPDATGDTPILAPDGAVQAVFGHVPANTGPVEYIYWLPGISGAGGTMVCRRATGSAAVNCNIVAQGEGHTLIGGGDGLYADFLPPGAPTTTNLTFLPGTTAGSPSANTTVLGCTLVGASNCHIAINPSGGVALGPTSIASTQGSVAAGFHDQAYGFGSFVSGNDGNDRNAYGARCHESGRLTTGFGTNQECMQTLQGGTSGTASIRLVASSTAGNVSNVYSMPVAANGHGNFKIDAHCVDATTGDIGSWSVTGLFVNQVNTFRLVNVAGTGAISANSGVLSTATIAVTADVTNLNFNVVVTPPGANTHALECGADVYWFQRIS